MRRRLVALGVALGAAVCPQRAAPQSTDIAVVVGLEVPADDLSFSEVRRVLMGDRQFWVPGLRVVLLMHPPAAREREIILKIVYQMTEPQFQQYWISKVFRAEVASSPKTLLSNEAMTDLVARIPGAVAFVDTKSVPKGLKVLKINGRLPGENGYPLR